MELMNDSSCMSYCSQYKTVPALVVYVFDELEVRNFVSSASVCPRANKNV